MDLCVLSCGPFSWLSAACKLPRDLAAEGRRQPVALTSLCWPGRAGLLLWLACSSPEPASEQHTSGFNDPLHRALKIDRETNPMLLYVFHSCWPPLEKQGEKNPKQTTRK